ncbi:hypothetical protein [Mycolicibacterium gilvum]|uniref:Uncharacterized protein n=1 Tax=Mycolicibacterium gilvum TaxID=1804 RepID=A0A378SJX9_9MYCO|nr:hypothetical protein [Mycolicibacterium gilvum]MCV7056292.1 hypothetical protein [Mycolicibacterium gilvum]STZ41717.1 Uncharacterised protein [Mycolicibacterium gilvum]
MWLSGRDFAYNIRLSPVSGRPIRLRIGGMTYCMDVAETVELANALADAIDDYQKLPPQPASTERTEQ